MRVTAVSLDSDGFLAGVKRGGPSFVAHLVPLVVCGEPLGGSQIFRKLRKTSRTARPLALARNRLRSCSLSKRTACRARRDIRERAMTGQIALKSFRFSSFDLAIGRGEADGFRVGLCASRRPRRRGDCVEVSRLLDSNQPCQSGGYRLERLTTQYPLALPSPVCRRKE